MTASNLKDLVKQIRGLNPHQKEELRSALGSGAGAATNIAAIEQGLQFIQSLLPILGEAGAAALLAETQGQARVSKRELVSRLAPYVDAQFDALEGQLPRLLLVLGRHGRTVLDEVLRQVNRARRGRGAAEVALLDAVMQIEANRVAQQVRDGVITEAEAHGAADPRAAEGYGPALEAYLAEVGAQGMAVLGSMDQKDVTYLREIKTWLRQNRPELADPARGSSDRFYRQVAAMLEQARRRGMGPITASRSAAEQAARKQQPNVLFEPLDGRGGAKWGGVYPNVKGTVTTTQQQREQGPKRRTEHKRLTPAGEIRMKRWEMNNPPGMGMSAQTLGIRREQEMTRLLTTPEGEGLWMWSFTLEELGFETVEVDRETQGPDHAYGGLFGGLSIPELMQQLAGFHQSKGKNPSPRDLTTP